MLQEQARQLLRDVPAIRTIVLLDEGMGSVKHGPDAWVSACSLLARTFWEVNPGLNVVTWTYTFAARCGTPRTPPWERTMDRLLRRDRRLGLMANVDSFWARRHDGQLHPAYDYSLRPVRWLW